MVSFFVSFLFTIHTTNRTIRVIFSIYCWAEVVELVCVWIVSRKKCFSYFTTLSLKKIHVNRTLSVSLLSNYSTSSPERLPVNITTVSLSFYLFFSVFFDSSELQTLTFPFLKAQKDGLNLAGASL